jgi:hypothetical protein
MRQPAFVEVSMVRRSIALLLSVLSLAGCIAYEPAPPVAAAPPAYYAPPPAYYYGPPAYYVAPSVSLGFGFGERRHW